ncbi:MAG: MFS transporter [Saprospiraceae bacterium]|nr:MFS transporter [Saprospiraceae bacterium]
MEKEHWSQLVLIGYIVTSSIAFQAVAPIMLGAMVDELGFTPQLIGLTMAVTTFGVAIAGLIVPFISERFGMLLLIRLGLATLIVFECFEAFTTNATAILVFRFIGGFAGGISYAASLGAYAALKQPIRGFSTYTIVFCIFSGFTLLTLPYIIDWGRLQMGYFMLIAFACIALLLTPVFKPYVSKSEARKVDTSVFQLLKHRNIIFTIVAYFALQGGSVALFSYLERIGVERAFSKEFIGFVLSLVGFFGLAGAILVTFVRDKIHPVKAVSIGFPFLFLSLFILYNTDMPIAFFVAILFFGVAWGFVLPFYQGLQAAYDTKGRIVSIGAFTNMMGQSAGPAMAAILVSYTTFSEVIWISLVLYILSVLTVIPAILGIYPRA